MSACIHSHMQTPHIPQTTADMRQCTHKCVQTCTHLLGERAHRARSSQQINKCARISREVTMATVSPSLFLFHTEVPGWLGVLEGRQWQVSSPMSLLPLPSPYLLYLFPTKEKQQNKELTVLMNAVSQVAQQPVHGSTGETLKKTCIW